MSRRGKGGHLPRPSFLGQGTVAAMAAPAVPVSEAEQADAEQFCSKNNDATDAINAAWPGDEPLAHFRRAVAGLLLRSQRKCQRPHTMTNVSIPRYLRFSSTHGL